MRFLAVLLAFTAPVQAFVLDGARWDREVVWYYNPAGQPSSLTSAQAVNAMTLATGRWSAVCNVRFRYGGITSAKPDVSGAWDTPGDSLNVLGWDKFIGAAAPYSALALARRRNGIIEDGDIVLNSSVSLSQLELSGLLTHEVGHMIGIAHSNVGNAVMADKPYLQFKAQVSLRADDVQACTALYGATQNQTTERVLNWAEQTYFQLSPPGSPTLEAQGYRYRYYPDAGLYAGTKNGNGYVSQGTIQDLGPIGPYIEQAKQAGF